MKLSAKDVAFVAVFAALSVVVIEFVPGIPIIGIPGAAIKFDAALAPTYGLVAGPYLGFLAALLAGLVTAGNPFSVLTSFAPAISALVAGLLTREPPELFHRRLKGWMMGAVILGLLVLGWYLSWVGQKAPFYPMPHLGALFAIVLTRGWAADSFQRAGTQGDAKWQNRPPYMLGGILLIVLGYVLTRPYVSEGGILSYFSLPLFFFGAITILYGLFGKGRGQFASAVCLASYCGVIADHMVGNLVFIHSIGIFIRIQDVEEFFLKPNNLPDVPSLFMYVLPVSIVERIIFTAIATILGVGLILALRRASLIPRES